MAAAAAAAAASGSRCCCSSSPSTSGSSRSLIWSTSSGSSPCQPRWRRQQQQQSGPLRGGSSRRRERPAGIIAAAAAAAGAGAFDAASGGGGEQQLQQLEQQQQQQLPPRTTTPPPPPRPSGLQRLLAPLRRVHVWDLAGPLAWAYMLGYLGLMLVLPISALLAKASLVPLAEFVARATEPVALSAYSVSFSMALAAAAINAVFGLLLAWVLVKYDFPGKKWIDAAVDLPFALPTSVAGLTLATVYGDEGLLGALLTRLGVNVVYTRLGVAVAMVFVSFPFVVRTMQPVLQEMEREVEEAAWSLGASPWHTFTRVILPPLLPPLLTGAALAFSRALGEYGSIVIVSSNFPFKDLIAPVLIFQCLEQYDFVGATVIGTVLLLVSLVMMVGVNWLQSYAQRFRRA